MHFTPSNLVSWWPGDGSGDDISGSNNGTLLNGAAFSSGMVDQAFSFDGVDDAVRCSASASLNVQDFTIDALIFPSSNLNPEPVVEWNGETASLIGVNLWINPNSLGYFYIEANIIDTGGNNHYLTTFPSHYVASMNAWNHIALTFESTTGTATLYLNGQPVAQNVLGLHSSDVISIIHRKETIRRHCCQF